MFIVDGRRLWSPAPVPVVERGGRSERAHFQRTLQRGLPAEPTAREWGGRAGRPGARDMNVGD